jgi:carbon-monoxide dehydrogenase medium subunit
MQSQKITYLSPSSVEEAVAFRSRYGDASCFISGGTEVVPLMARGKFEQSVLIELSRLDALRVFEEFRGGLRIGAATTWTALEESPLVREGWTALADAAASNREPQVRNRGTIGGNIALGVTCADLVPPLLVFDAEVVLCGGAGERMVRVEDFLVGPYKTMLRDDELISEIRLAEQGRLPGSAFFKLTKFGGSGLSIATVAAGVRMDHGRISVARIAIGSAGPVPKRVREAERVLEGEAPTEEVLAEAGRLVSAAADPREESIRSSPAHRRRVLGALARRVVERAMQRSQELSVGADI